MRQLLIQVPQGQGARVAEDARRLGAINLARLEATGEDGPIDVVIAHLSNGDVQPLLERLDPLPDVRLSFFPQGVLALKPPSEEAPDQVTDVGMRSPVEVFLAGRQSIGSWRGFLGYAAAAGAVVWTGLYTNTIFLLTAAMLIAPFAGPAMNAALATASGDGGLLRRSLVRYAAALALTIAVAALLSLLVGLETATAEMVARSQVSSMAVLLPLVAGAAGALNLLQSDRDSLVSGAAIGVLVAASLAPPTGLVGMAVVIGRWDMALSGLYVLLLQLAGINLSGALVFRWGGLAGGGARFKASAKGLFRAGLAASALALVALLAWQFTSPLALQRASLDHEIASQMRQAVEESALAAPVEVSARFTRTDVQGQSTLLGVVYAQRHAGVTFSDEEVSQQLAELLRREVRARWPYVTPLVRVSLFDPPRGGGPESPLR